ncbi:TPA: hypothetical protein DCX16_06750 [bacterium]|nr:hypothetical protein [bacterium]
MEHKYDTTYSHPVPVIELTVSSNSEEKKCIGIIDSGVEMTCIPEEIVEELRLRLVGIIAVTDFKGQVSEMCTYLANISFGDFNFKVEVLPINGNKVLIGRDILNHLVITLDGKRGICEIKGD